MIRSQAQNLVTYGRNLEHYKQKLRTARTEFNKQKARESIDAMERTINHALSQLPE